MEKSKGLDQINTFVNAIKNNNELDSFYEFYYYIWRKGEPSGQVLHKISAKVFNLWIGSKFDGIEKNSLVLHFKTDKYDKNIQEVYNYIPLYKGQSTIIFEELDIHFSIIKTVT